MKPTDFVIPVIIAAVLLVGLLSGVDIWNEFLLGAKENMMTAVEILPALIGIMTAIGVFRASGAVELLCSALSPLTTFLGFPEECLPLAIIRPVSGSGALGVYEQILSSCGADSFAGRVASVIMGSTETTFYTIAVYYGATKIKNTRHTLVCSLAGDFTGFVISALAVNLLFG